MEEAWAVTDEGNEVSEVDDDNDDDNDDDDEVVDDDDEVDDDDDDEYDDYDGVYLSAILSGSDCWVQTL